MIARFLYRVCWAAWLVKNRGLTWKRAWLLTGFYQRMAEEYFGGRSD